MMPAADRYPDQSWHAVVEMARPLEVEMYLIDEIFRAAGFKVNGRLRRWFGWVFKPIVRGFARQAAGFDRAVASQGFQLSSKEWLQQWTPDLKLIGAEQLPQHGPLLIVANHPGTFDALAVASALPRQDLKIIAAANPFFRSLPNTRCHFIYSTLDTDVRVATIRNALRHLRGGGALLFFPSGKMDPDPQHFAQAARQAINRWSASLDLFVSKTPNIRLVAAINSGFVSSTFLQNPIIRLIANDSSKQKIAEFFQVIQQVVFNQRVISQPRVVFGELALPHSHSESAINLHDQILAMASNLMDMRAIINPSENWSQP